jgi:hypothetical protein
MYYGTPPIVTNGLVLALDAASPIAAPTRNLFTYTTDLTNVAWSKIRCSITASAAIAPDGTNTAFAFNMSTGSANLKRLSAPNISSAVSGGLYTFSIFVKQNNYSGSSALDTGLQLGNYNNGQTAGTEPAFNILSNFQPNGVFIFGPASSGSTVDRGTIDVGNGWYRIYTTINWASNIAGFSNFLDLDNGILTGSQYEGTGIYVWGPQFETGYLSPYQPVTGTTKPWPSIGSRITASMVNNPTWVSSNGGSVVFDGVNDTVQLGSPNISTACTINQWIQPLSGSVNTMRTIEYVTVNSATTIIFSHLVKISNTWYHQVLISGYQSGYAAEMNLYQQSNVNQFVQNNTPYNFTFTWERTPGINSTLKTYLNGVYREQDIQSTPYWTNTASLATATYNIANTYKGNIATTSFYNRALSQAEITQNFNALKSRYGL